MGNKKLCSTEGFLGRVKAGFVCWERWIQKLIWKLRLDSCAQDPEELCKPSVERRPGGPGDEVAIDDGVGHGEIDIRAASESNVRTSGRLGAALLSFQDSRGGEDLPGVANGGDRLLTLFGVGDDFRDP